MTFVIQYRDGYGALHNVEVLAEDIDEAWKLAEEFKVSTDKVQQIWKKS